MIIDHVNLNHIRIFECVFRLGSMTLAARELHLTQSGISQHIKTLEEMLEVKLFDRIQQKLVPTSAATLLYDESVQGLNRIEKALWKIKGAEEELTGSVSVGMPVEFGINVILPLIAKFARKHPLVQVKVRLGLASEMNELIMKGEVDFAFIDDFRMDRRIRTEKVYDEVLELCISEELLKRKGGPLKQTRKYFETLEYVEYQEGAPILGMWFQHHLEVSHPELNIRALVSDAQAIGRLICKEVGAGVLPSHLLAKLQKEGHRLTRFKGRGDPLKNAISVAYLAERTHSPAALTALESLKASLQEPPAKPPVKSTN